MPQALARRQRPEIGGLSAAILADILLLLRSLVEGMAALQRTVRMPEALPGRQRAD